MQQPFVSRFVGIIWMYVMQTYTLKYQKKVNRVKEASRELANSLGHVAELVVHLQSKFGREIMIEEQKRIFKDVQGRRNIICKYN